MQDQLIKTRYRWPKGTEQGGRFRSHGQDDEGDAPLNDAWVQRISDDMDRRAQPETDGA